MKYPFVVIGAGAGGLVVAIGLAKAGKRVLLIEKGPYGGDCTNFGCIPSKTLIASKDPIQALSRIRGIVEEIREHEEPKALEQFGVETRTGVAHFQGPHTLEVNGELIEGRQIVIATGSSPYIPKIPGLDKTPFLTNETVFDLQEIPKSLVVIGGGPIGSELAQAFSRLGAKVSLIHSHSQLLNREIPKAGQVIADQFRQDGIDLYLGASVKEVSFANNQFKIILEKGQMVGEALLVATGRKPNVSSLHLEAAGVVYSEEGIPVDSYGRTNQSHIWAIGDVVGKPFFTHLAENQGRSVLTSLLLPIKKKIDKKQSIPRVTFTTPEVASLGLSEIEASKRYNIATYTVPFSKLDRALTADRREGFVTIVTKKWSSKILGCTIVADRAGEMLGEVSLAMYAGIPLRKLAGLIHPYPTYNLAIRKAADLWLTETILKINFRKYLPIIIICLVMLVIYFLGITEYLSLDSLRVYHKSLKAFQELHPVLVPLIFCLIYILSTALSIPGGLLLTLLGGYLFPQPFSTIYVVLSATCGATVIFLAARTAFADVMKRKAGPFLQKMEKGFQENAVSYLLVLRFIPLFPFWLVNVAPAFFGVPLATFFWTTLIGILPGTLVLTLAGGGLENILDSGQATFFNREIILALLLLSILALVPVVWKKFREES